MLSDFTGADRVYIACGYTDLRRGIDGLAVKIAATIPRARKKSATVTER